MVDLDDFRRRLDEMIRQLHSCPVADGHERVYYPGEREGLSRIERSRTGIPIGPGVYAELETLGRRLGVELTP